MKRNIFEKNLLVSLFSIVLVAACVGDRENAESTDSIDSANVPIEQPVLKTPILWTYDAVGDSMVKNHIPDSLTLDLVINDLNKRYQGLKLEIVRSSLDTVFVKIDDVTYLSGLGSTGNYGFMAEVIYSLTEVDGVNLVNFDFPELDHAAPGLYNRADMDNKL